MRVAGWMAIGSGYRRTEHVTRLAEGRPGGWHRANSSAIGVTLAGGIWGREADFGA
jgi:hypothetical protein